MARHYLAVLLLYIERQLSDSHTPIEEAAVAPREEHMIAGESTPFQRARSYIETHFAHKLTLTQLAAYCYVSPTHLNRLFRAEMKMSVGEYLLQRRLKQARVLLENTDLPIQRVGALSGFRRAEHFNRTFRQHIGQQLG